MSSVVSTPPDFLDDVTAIITRVALLRKRKLTDDHDPIVRHKKGSKFTSIVKILGLHHVAQFNFGLEKK